MKAAPTTRPARPGTLHVGAASGRTRHIRSRYDTGLMIPLLLACAVVGSALAVVRVKHENRQLTTQIEKLRVERDRLDMEWAQLQLEEAALAQHARIERLAREELGMAEPRDYQIIGRASGRSLVPTGSASLRSAVPAGGAGAIATATVPGQ